MKFLKYFFIIGLSFVFFNQCSSSDQNKWRTIKAEPISTPKIIDISADFFNPKISPKHFAKNFPWFINPDITIDSVESIRKSPKEIEIYQTSLKANSLPKIQTQINDLFAHIHYYYPNFASPNVYVFSSGLKQIYEPIIFAPKDRKLFIDLSGFNGKNSKFYKGLDLYQRLKMNPENLVPRVGNEVVNAFEMRPPKENHFLSNIINYGKRMILKDAFLPKISDALKMNYTEHQNQWAIANEANVWNFFIENKILYSEHSKYLESFVNEGPFSKFYTDIDRESSPQIGIWIGWQICKKYWEKHPDTSLQEFLALDEISIFKESEYYPK